MESGFLQCNIRIIVDERMVMYMCVSLLQSKICARKKVIRAQILLYRNLYGMISIEKGVFIINEEKENERVFAL